MTRNSRLLRASFFFVFWVLLLAGCAQVSVFDLKSLSKDELDIENAIRSAKPCARALLGDDTYKLVPLVQLAREHSRWPPSHDLRDGNANIVISTPDQRILFSVENNRGLSADFYRAYGRQSKNKMVLTCLDSSSRPTQPAVAIKNPQKRLGKERIDFLFVYPGSKDSLVRDGVDLNAVAKAVGKFLYIEVGALDKRGLIELQRTIVHEGAHFFCQTELLAASPKGGDEGFSSRQLLMAQYRGNIDFRDSVDREICVAKELLEAVFSDTKKNKSEVKSLLLKMIKIANDRRESSGTNVNDAEKFWYLVEGIPQYLDHAILIQNGAKSAIIDPFDAHCTNGERYTNAFYPLLAGAAIGHGLDFVLGSREAWKNSAKFDAMGPNNWMMVLKNLE